LYRLPRPKVVRVKNLEDLARLAVALSAHTNHEEVPVVYHVKLRENNEENNTKDFLFIIHYTPGYYNLSSLPILFLLELNQDYKIDEKRFIAYFLSENGEQIELTSVAKPGWRIYPIIHLKNMPSWLLPIKNSKRLKKK